MANAIQSVFPEAIHVLDRFHLVQFFTDALQRRRRFLGEAKKHHKARFIDRCLARKTEELTEEERGFVAEWHREDVHTKSIYQALNHLRYVLKSTTMTQAKRRLNEWIKRFQIHLCAAVSKIAKTLIARKQALLDTIISSLSNASWKGPTIKLNSLKDVVLAIEMMPIFFSDYV